MRRRAYLAATLTATVGGCVGGGGPADDDPPTDGNGSATEEPPAESPSAVSPAPFDTFDNFSDVDAWEVLRGSAAVDDGRSVAGDRSIQLEAGESGSSVDLRLEPSAPVDASDVLPGLAAFAEREVTATIDLVDEGGDRFRCRARLSPRGTFDRYNFGVTDVEGDPDLGEVTELLVSVWLGEAGRRLWIDDLHFVPRPSGRVMVHFDGGYESVATEALPILDEYGLPATTFVPTERVREERDHEGSRLTEDQLEELADAGWALGSYGTRGLDLTGATDAERREAVADAADWLEAAGYGDGARFFAYPTGRYDEATLEVVADVHDLGFATGHVPAGAAVDERAYPRASAPDPDKARELLDRTAAYGGVATLVYYDLAGDALAAFEETMSALADLQSAGAVEVVLPGDLEV